MKVLSSFTVIVLTIFVSQLLAVDQTQTGFYYPTGVSTSSTNWMARSCPPYTEYISGLYHIGSDISASLGSSVYAVSDVKNEDINLINNTNVYE